MLGFRPLHVRPRSSSHRCSARGRVAPDSLDYRDYGAVNAIKDQLQCGSCWAFSAIGAQESQGFLTFGTLLVLSEQNLVDCDANDAGCDGGLPSIAYEWVIIHQAGQFSLSSDYPYAARDQSCQFGDHAPASQIVGYISTLEGDESDLQVQLAGTGPVAAGIDASWTSFQLYQSGVYDEPRCGNGEDDLDHGIVVIGYGTDAATPFWIVRNSWGTGWGEKGYVRMSRNKNNQCGIATTAVIPIDKRCDSDGKALA
jgi:cathepsin L